MDISLFFFKHIISMDSTFGRLPRSKNCSYNILIDFEHGLFGLNGFFIIRVIRVR